MTRSQLTLLVEDLAALAAAASDARCPALERCLARGRPLQNPVADADRLRLRLFGLDGGAPAPVGALTALAEGLAVAADSRCWLRVEPVTLTADLTRVFVTAHGLDDVDAEDRAALQDCVRAVLADEGLALESARPERWLLALADPPTCDFMRLDEALGLDLAEALPGGAEGRAWRRIMSEVQVALHNTGVNRRRRAEGRREINGIWLWGAGRLPATTPKPPWDRVVCDHPVTAGLARLARIAVGPVASGDLVTASAIGDRLLVDWPTGREGARRELERVEAAVAGLLPSLRRGRLELTLLDGSGTGWRLDRRAWRRFWRRPRALAEVLSRGVPE